MNHVNVDVIVVGGGAGGLSAASGLAQLGLSVTLINNEPDMGGDCLHHGCIPSKTLIHASKIIQNARDAQKYNLHINFDDLDGSKIFASVRDAIAKIQPHDSIERFESLGVNVKIGSPRFLDPHTIELNDTKLRARYIVLATGSRPNIPPIPGIEDIHALHNETLFKLNRLPKHLAILGGGAIGCELAQAMQRLGVKVTLLEALPSLLPFLDPAMADIIQKRFESESISVLTNSTVAQFESRDSDIDLHYTHNEIKMKLTCDAILVATGRKPNVEGLNLEGIGITCDRFGIQIDHRCRTRYKHIFAIGDVCNTPQKFTHHAEYQAGIVLQNIAFRLPKSASPAFIPACVYTDPEIAHIGLSAREAREQYTELHIESLPLSKIDRTITDDVCYGSGQFVLSKGKLVGVTIISPRAGDYISEWRYVLNRKLSLADLASNVHPYPNYAQWNKRIAGQYYGRKLFAPLTRQLVRLLHWKWT